MVHCRKSSAFTSISKSLSMRTINLYPPNWTDSRDVMFARLVVMILPSGLRNTMLSDLPPATVSADLGSGRGGIAEKPKLRNLGLGAPQWPHGNIHACTACSDCPQLPHAGRSPRICRERRRLLPLETSHSAGPVLAGFGFSNRQSNMSAICDRLRLRRLERRSRTDRGKRGKRTISWPVP